MTTTTGSVAGPLAGTRVIDASTVLAGPLAAQLLGDFGADVIKVEHPQHGDSMRTHGPAKDGVGLWWKLLNRNKRCVGIDLKHPDGARVFRHLVGTADVLVENFRPGTLERWELGPDVLRADNPGLVVVRVTGFGQTGPYAARPGFGTLAEAMSGFASVMGRAEDPPMLPPFGLADSICGLAAANAAVMALYHRDRVSGAGQVVDISLLEPIISVLGPYPTVFDQLGVLPQRLGNRSEYNAPRNTYRTFDGRWVALSTSADAIARRLMHLVGAADLADEPWFGSGRTRASHADVLDEAVGTWVAQRSLSEVLSACAEAGVAAAPVYDVAGLLADEHVVARGVFTRVPDPELGDVLMPDVLWRMSETPGSVRWSGASQIGADTDETLRELLGLEHDTVEQLRRRGAIR